MNPAQLATSTQHPADTVLLPASRLTIIKVDLPQQSTPHYDVILRLRRPLINYESHERVAHRSIGLDVSPDDPAQLIAIHSTIEVVCDLPEFHELLAAAVANGHAAHHIADTNTRFGACPHTHELVMDA